MFSWVRRAAWGVLILVAATLGAGALVTSVLAGRAEAAFPASGRIMRVEGLRQHVVERGEGRPVVFVHGAFGGLQDFEATLLDETVQRYHCVLWDRPGHGYSERPVGDVDPAVQGHYLVGLLRELELERPVLVGFSYGGAVCLAAALEAPGEIGGLLLVNAPSHPWPDPMRLEYRLSGVPVLGWLLSETLVAPLGTLLGRKAVGRAFDPLPVPALFERSPLSLALRPHSYRANAEDVRVLNAFLGEQSQHYANLTPRVLALVATGDKIVSPTIHMPQLVEQAPSCRQIRLDGAGHQLLYTHTQLVLDALDQLMEEG